MKTNHGGFCAELGCLSLVLETVENHIALLDSKVYIIYLDASVSSPPKHSPFL